MTHTPGPWEVKPIGKQLYVATKNGQGFVCDMQISDQFGELDSPRIRADAALIAAAPTMYEALKELADMARVQLNQSATNTGLANCHLLAKAREAIRLAEGRG